MTPRNLAACRLPPSLWSEPIRAYFIEQANSSLATRSVLLIGLICSNTPALARFLLIPFQTPQVWDTLPVNVERHDCQEYPIYVIDASQGAETTGMGNRINRLCNLFLRHQRGTAKRRSNCSVKHSLRLMAKGENCLMNYEAVDQAVAYVQGQYPNKSQPTPPPTSACQCSCFVKEVLGEMIARNGDKIP